MASDKGTDLPELHRAVILKDMTMFETGIDTCENINFQYQDRVTALMLAAFNGCIEFK